MIEPKSVQDEFFSYLSKQMPSFQLTDAYLMLSHIERFCLDRNVLQNKTFETTDFEAIKRLLKRLIPTVSSVSPIRETWKKMSTLIHDYCAFLRLIRQMKAYRSAVPAPQNELPSENDIETSKQLLLLKNQNLILKKNH